MIVVKVRDRDIKAAPMGPVTTGSVGLPVSWHFSEEWDDLAKTAVFRVGEDGEEITVAVLEDLCLVPDELLVQANADENLWIGVYGWKGTNANDTIVPEIAMPTIWTYTRIQDGSQPSGIEPPEGTPGWSAQIQNATDEALRVAHGVAADAAEGDFDGISPAVTISSITHGHSVTITDRDHPTGQSFNVLDGDSAYEQAVAGGYTGTEAQFNEELASFKELSEQAADSAEDAAEVAPFYAEYGVTTKAAVVAAINGKRQVYVSGTLGMDYAPLVGTFLYTPLFGEELQTGYRFAIVEGTTQYIYDLADEWSSSTNDLSAPAQAAATSAQAAATTATTFTEQTVPAAVNTINEAKADALTAVGNAQTTAVGAVQQESTTQQAAIQQKGEETLASIPEDYTTLSDDVDNLKSAIQYTNVSMLFTSGGILATGGVRTDNTRIRSLSNAYCEWLAKEGDYLVISPEYSASVYAYNARAITSANLYRRILEWSNGTCKIPDDCIGKYIALVVRKIGSESENISAEVPIMGNYVKYYRVATIDDGEYPVYVALGASTTEGVVHHYSGEDNTVSPYNYPAYIGRVLNMDTYNMGIGSTGFLERGDSGTKNNFMDAIYTSDDVLKRAGLITLMFGYGNDHYVGTSPQKLFNIGSYTDYYPYDEAGYHPSGLAGLDTMISKGATFMGCLNWCIKWISEKYPYAQLILIFGSPSANDGRTIEMSAQTESVGVAPYKLTFSEDPFKNASHDSAEYGIYLINEELKKLKNAMDIPIVNLFYEGNAFNWYSTYAKNPDNSNEYALFSTKGTTDAPVWNSHPNNAGYKYYARFVAGKVISLFKH